MLVGWCMKGWCEMSLKTRKIMLVVAIVAVVVGANIWGIAAWLNKAGVVDLAKHVRREYLTGTAITIIVVLLIAHGRGEVLWKVRELGVNGNHSRVRTPCVCDRIADGLPRTEVILEASCLWRIVSHGESSWVWGRWRLACQPMSDYGS